MQDESNGYEAIAQDYISQRSESIGVQIVQEWAHTIPPGTEVLDLGCGHGLPISKVLAETGLQLYGVDASPTLVASYQKNIPGAKVDCASVEKSQFFQQSFGAVIAWGLLFLLSPANQELVIQKVGASLKASGKFLFTSPHHPAEWRDNLTGRTSVSLGTETYQRLLNSEHLYVEDEIDDEGGNHYYFVRKKTAELRINSW